MTGKMERVSQSFASRASNNPVSAVSAGTGLLYGELSLPLGVQDEYNPLFPNDYEELTRQRREKRKADVSYFRFLVAVDQIFFRAHAHTQVEPSSGQKMR